MTSDWIRLASSTARVLLGCALLLSAGVGFGQEPSGSGSSFSPPPGRSATETLTALTREGETDRPTERHLETDRDSFTPSATTAGRGRLILESAYSFVDNRRGPETHSFPEMLLRVGVTERVELRLGWNYEVGGGGSSVSTLSHGTSTEGAGLPREYRITYGLKTAVTEQDHWVPESSLLLQAATPAGGESTATAFEVGSVLGWELADRRRFDTAVRYIVASEEGDRFGVWAPSAVLRVPVGERWNVHAEYFGLFATDRRENFVRHFVSPGVHYLVTPDLEVGVRVGWGLNDQSARFFANAGLGWRY